jgi:hypothetical protein
MFKDTQIDTQEVVAGGQNVSAAVPMKNERNERSLLLASGEQTFSPSETASVMHSPKAGEGAPCRNRTCNPVIKSHLLCQLS